MLSTSISRYTAPYFYRKNGHGIFLNYLAQVEANQWKNPRELAEIQLKKRKRLLKHAFTSVPYYQSILASTGIKLDDLVRGDAFCALPVTKKQDFAAKQSLFFATGVDPQTLVTKFTSGTTSTPLKLYFDRDRCRWSWAYNTRHNRWAGYSWGAKIATMWMKPEHHPLDMSDGVNQNSSKRLRTVITGKFDEIFFPPYGYTDSTLDEFLTKLKHFRPTTLLGYSRTVYDLALQALQSNNRPELPNIICGAEPLSVAEKEVIQNAFSARVFRRYGSREFDIIASECEHGNQHVNADNLLLEFMDVENSDTQSDAKRLVITDLNNFAMPLIRYDLGDLVSASDKTCPCGRTLPVLGEIQGRVVDQFVAPNGARYSGLWFKHLMQSYETVRSYQLRQKQLDRFELALVPAGAGLELTVEDIKSRITKEFGAKTTIQVSIVDNIPQDRSGKFRFIISDLPH